MDPDQRTAAVESAHAQTSHQLRLDWSPTGATAIGADADVAGVVDTDSVVPLLTGDGFVATRH